jgi:hypothetical protein
MVVDAISELSSISDPEARQLADDLNDLLLNVDEYTYTPDAE